MTGHTWSSLGWPSGLSEGVLSPPGGRADVEEVRHLMLEECPEICLAV